MTPEAAPTVAGLPFVGRDATLAELDGVLAAAGQGRGALVLIRGEAGIGKTTLAARAADRAAALAAELGATPAPAASREGGQVFFAVPEFVVAKKDLTLPLRRRRVVAVWNLTRVSCPGRMVGPQPQRDRRRRQR